MWSCRWRKNKQYNMNCQHFKNFFLFTAAVILILGLSISFQSLLAAWTAPSVNPPTCASGKLGCDAPLNIGPLAQTKLGALRIVNQNYPASPYGLIVENGNIGIGTAGPDNKLTVNGGGLTGSGINNVFRLSGGTMTSVNDATGLLFIQRDANDDYGAAIRSVNTQSTPNWLNPRLDFFVQNPDTNTQANIGVKMSILGNGNVGIGTTNPSSKLEVAGQVKITGPLAGLAISGQIFDHQTDNFFYLNSFDGLQLRVNSNGGAANFQINNSSNSTVFTVTNAGRIGIGTTRPTDVTKLDVIGKVRIADGTEGANKLFVSSPEGIGSWQKALPEMYFDKWCSADGTTCLTLFELINRLNNPPQPTTIINTSYAWVYGAWSGWINVDDEDCYGRPCVWQYRTRSVTCVGDQSGTIVANAYCSGVPDPAYERRSGSCGKVMYIGGQPVNCP